MTTKSRQLLWQEAKRAQGLCPCCGKQPGDYVLCDPCNQKRLDRHRRIREEAANADL